MVDRSCGRRDIAKFVPVGWQISFGHQKHLSLSECFDFQIRKHKVLQLSVSFQRTRGFTLG